MTTASKPGARRSAALKFVEEDLGLPAAIERLHEINDALIDAVQQREIALLAYDDTKRFYDEREISVEFAAVDSTERAAGEAKPSQASIDRRAKLMKANDKELTELGVRLAEDKNNLTTANSEWDAARHGHRTIIAQVNAMTAQLHYLTASKQAAAASVAMMAGL